MPTPASSIPAFDSNEIKELKQKLVDGCHILDHEGITDGFGHVSVRIPGTEAFLTIANVSPGCATLQRLVMLDLNGKFLGGINAPPYEWPIHSCILKTRPEVMSVCHTHSKWSSLFSVLKGGLRPLHVYAKFLPIAGPPVYPAAGLIGTIERGMALAASLKDSAAVLMRAHGDAVVGASLEEAILRTIRLAFVSELAHMAVAHGEPLYMTEEELATFAADQAFPARPWEYYLSRVRERSSP
ncbi:MAG TPA: class II aldolase/adducin family protein [Candidatus Binatia bacterium]|jgi:L-fuculose-phosphate aldolase|nr:class II aldolase/adducin family protein [Candidatus Binatia bacterium]